MISGSIGSAERVSVDQREHALGGVSSGLFVGVDHEIGLAGRVVEVHLDKSFSTKPVGSSD